MSLRVKLWRFAGSIVATLTMVVADVSQLAAQESLHKNSSNALLADSVVRIPDALGIGDSENAALMSAMEEAVKKAVGLYIEIEKTLHSDHGLVKEIAALSNGYIVRYEKLIQPQTSDGKYQVLITADVSRERLENNLIKNKIWTRSEGTSTAPVGGRNLNANILSERKRDADAAKLLSIWMSRSPLKDSSILGMDIADVPDRPTAVKDVPKAEERNHKAEYEYPVRCRVYCDPTPILEFGNWLDRAMSHVKLGKRQEFTYSMTAKTGNWQGHARKPTPQDSDIFIVLEPPTTSLFDYRWNTHDHPFHKLEENESAFVIITGIDWKTDNRVSLKVAAWTISKSTMSQFLQPLGLSSNLNEHGYSLAAYGIDRKKEVVSKEERSILFYRARPLLIGGSMVAVYGPFVTGEQRPYTSIPNFGFAIPYKFVLRVGATLDQLALIEDVEASLVECAGRDSGNGVSAKRIGNRIDVPPAAQEQFLKQFDLSTSAKAILRTPTYLAPNRSTNRHGTTRAWASLAIVDSGNLKPLAGKTIAVYIQRQASPRQLLASYQTDQQGRIEFTEPPRQSLPVETKLIFEFGGDEEYSNSAQEMRIR